MVLRQLVVRRSFQRDNKNEFKRCDKIPKVLILSGFSLLCKELEITTKH